MSAQAADFNIRFNAESAEFSKDVEYAKKMLRGYTKEARAANDGTASFDRSMIQSTKTVKTMGRNVLKTTGMVAAGIGTITAASTYLLRQQADLAREIERMATVAQVSTDRIQGLAYASEQYNIQGDKFADILKDVNDKLGDFAQTGGGEFKDFFVDIAPQVGLTIDELKRLSGPEALIAIKTALDQANVPMKEQIFFLESIANDASALLPILEDKGRRLYELTQHYDNLNVAMSKVDIEQFKVMDQQIKDMELRLSRAFGNLSRQVSYGLLPAMEDVSQFVADLTKGVKDYTAQVEAMGMASATINVLTGTSLREKHRELFAEMMETKEELAKYDEVNYDDLPSINPFGLSKNEWSNLQRDYGLKRDQLKALNDSIVAEQKRLYGSFTPPKAGGEAEPPPGGGDGGKGEKLAVAQEAGAAKLAMLDQMYADERTKLEIANQSRLAEIDAMQLSEQEITRQGFDSMAALKQEYRDREQEFFDQQVQAYNLQQDEQIQRELDGHQRKEDEKNRTSEKAAAQRLATERRIEQQLLSMKYGVASQTLALIEQTAKEGSFIQKAAFVTQKAMAAMQVYQQGEVAAMTAMAAPPVGLGTEAGSGYAMAIRGMAAASAGMIMGQALAGMAHSGIDAVPSEGTWLLDKGERVYTNESARQIDMMFRTVMTMATRAPANDPALGAGNRAVASGGQYHFSMPIQIAVSEETSPEQAKQLGLGVKQLVLETINNEKRPGGLLWAS